MPRIELIEKKNKPTMTRFKFSKREYNMLPFTKRAEWSQVYEVHETARTVYFDVKGDLLNPPKQMKEQKLCSNGKPCKHPKCNKCGTTHFMSECDYGKEQKENGCD